MKSKNDELNENLDANLTLDLEKLRNVPPRNQQKAALGRAKFLFEAQEIRQAVSPGSKLRHKGWKLSPLWSRKEPVRMSTLVTIILILGLVFGGSTATVAAAQTALPDQALYGLKLTSENTRAQLAIQTQTRFELALEFANRRVDEIEKLQQKGVTPPDALLARYQNQIQTAFQLAAGMPDEDISPSLLRLQQMLQQQEQTMLRLQDQNPDSPLLLQMMYMIHTRLQFALGGLEDPQAFRHQVQSGQDEEFIPPQGPGDEPPGGYQNGGSPWTDEQPAPGNGYNEGNGNPWTDESADPSSSFEQDGGNPWTDDTPTPYSGYGEGNGGNPWTDDTPTPGSGYGDGNGGNPYAIGTPTPGSGYGPGSK